MKIYKQVRLVNCACHELQAHAPWCDRWQASSTELAAKLLKVIDSCKTARHLKAARNMVRLAEVQGRLTAFDHANVATKFKQHSVLLGPILNLYPTVHKTKFS